MPRFDGADISHYQADKGPIDWALLRSVSSWVATKATQGLKSNDPTCDTHRANMAAQAFTHRGFYHWITPKVDPAGQARHYLDCIGTLHPGEFVMLDAEEAGITAAECLAWLRAVEQVTRRPASVYTGAYVAGGTVWQSTEVRHSLYGPRPMHLAAYTTEAKAKALPGVAAYPWSAWQYSSNGPVPGVVGRCDMNQIDIVAHYDLAAGISATPPPFPPPNPLPEDDTVDIRLLTLTDSDAQFLAETTSDGRALNCRWADGSAKMQAVVAAHRGAAAGKQKVFEQSGNIAGLANVALLGQLPVGDSKHAWTGAEFSAFDNPATAVVDQVARDEAAHANEAVTRIGSTISDIRMGGQRIADAGGT